MNVVLYMRYSSANQTEQSIEGQERVCMAYCKQMGYEIVGRYIDRATSASKDVEKRHQFLQMIKDAEKGHFQGVVVYKLDRFARNRYHSATYKAKLKKYGVRLISATENITDNPEGVLLESLLEGMAEFYSAELSQKVTRGMHESALKANVCGGSVPLGYKVEGKKFVIDEAKAQIVREAFQLYSEGYPIRQICRIFNEKGYRTGTGSAFNKNSFNVMFRNERYTGVYIHGDTRIEGAMPVIIDKDLFESVKKRVELNKHAPARSKGTVDYLLTQKLFCGNCGSPMVGESGTSMNGPTYYYYKCTRAKREHTCDMKAIRKDWIEQVVAEDAISAFTPEVIDELADIAVKACEEELARSTVIPALRSEVRKIDQAIKNLFTLVERGDTSEALYRRLGELEDQKRGAELRLRDAEADVIILEKDHIVWWLSKFKDGSIDDPIFRRKVVDLLVNSVTVYHNPDGTYHIEYVINLIHNKNRTIKSSDLDFAGAPPESNPNFHRFGFILFPAYACSVFTRNHPAP